MTFGLAVLPLVAILSIVPKQPPARNTPVPKTWLDEARRLLRAGQYPELEELVNQEVIDLKGNFSPPVVEAFCKKIHGRFELIDDFRDWAEASPKFWMAHVGLGYLLVGYAWEARGGGWGYEVSQEGMRLFKERLEEGEREFVEARQLEPRDARSSVSLIIIDYALGRPRAEAEDNFQKAIKAWPGNEDAYDMYLQFLSPKWRGSLPEALEFIKKSVAELPEDGDFIMQLVNVHAETWAMKRHEEGYFRTQEVWDDVRYAYETYLKTHPKDLFRLNGYAYYAMLAGQYSTARAQFAAIDGKWEKWYWQDPDLFDASVREATEGGARETFSSLIRKRLEGVTSLKAEDKAPGWKGEKVVPCFMFLKHKPPPGYDDESLPEFKEFFRKGATLTPPTGNPGLVVVFEDPYRHFAKEIQVIRKTLKMPKDAPLSKEDLKSGDPALVLGLFQYIFRVKLSSGLESRVDNGSIRVIATAFLKDGKTEERETRPEWLWVEPKMKKGGLVASPDGKTFVQGPPTYSNECLLRPPFLMSDRIEQISLAIFDDKKERRDAAFVFKYGLFPFYEKRRNSTRAWEWVFDWEKAATPVPTPLGQKPALSL